MYVLLSILPMLLMVGALVDLITIDSARVKHLPKFAWIIIAILLPLVGSILWFAIGREYVMTTGRGGSGVPMRREPQAGTPPLDFGRSERSAKSAGLDGSGGNYSGGGKYGGGASGDTQAQLDRLDREIAAHEQSERIRQLEAELEAKRKAKGAES